MKIPKLLPQWIAINTQDTRGGQRFVGLRELVRNNLQHLFSGMIIGDIMQMRVTRGVALDDDFKPEQDLLETVEEELRLRRLQDVVRLEHSANPSCWLLDKVVSELDLSPEQVYEMPGELDYRDLHEGLATRFAPAALLAFRAGRTAAIGQRLLGHLFRHPFWRRVGPSSL